MAYRDSSQGFAFVYTNLAKLIAQGAKVEEQPLSEVYPNETKALNFNKDTVIEKPREVVKHKPEPKADKTNVQEIKENLDRLQSLHQKLHLILSDLNHIAEAKKKKN